MAGEKINTLHGTNLDARDTTPVFALGTVAHGTNDGGAPLKFIYAQANGAVAASNADGTVSALGQLSDGAGAYHNSAVAFADNEYGWCWTEVN